MGLNVTRQSLQPKQPTLKKTQANMHIHVIGISNTKSDPDKGKSTIGKFLF